MYHHSNLLYFGRFKNGSVRVLKLKTEPPFWPNVESDFPEAILDLKISATQWASIIAAVSNNPNDFSKAWEVHNGTVVRLD